MELRQPPRSGTGGSSSVFAISHFHIVFGRKLAAMFQCFAQGVKVQVPRRADYSQGSTKTGSPTQTKRAKNSAFQFARRKQPCDSARPTCSGRGVPWIP